MRPTPYESTNYTSVKRGNSTQLDQLEFQVNYEDEKVDYQTQQDQMVKTQVFYEQTQGEQKIWRLFKTLDCQDCQKMYNNKQQRPQIICANNHLLCKSCYLRTRQSSLLCPWCGVRMNTRNTSSHESIQLFLKIYNQIFEKQKNIVQQKRKRSYLDFSIPKNIKTISVLLLIMITPWIYDAMKVIVCAIVDFEYQIMVLVMEQAEQVVDVVRIVVQDEFYIGLYTNQNREYVFHSDQLITQTFYTTINTHHHNNSSFNAHSFNIFTQKHKSKIQFYLKFLSIATFIYTKFIKFYTLAYQILRLFNYCLHFIILLAGLVQFPFIISFILFRVEFFVPRKYKYKIGLYLDILEEDNADQYLDPEDIDKLSKPEFYSLLLIRNYIQAILQLYKTIQTDMKKRCEQLEYKKRMRQLKKIHKQSTTLKPNKRFTF